MGLEVILKLIRRKEEPVIRLPEYEEIRFRKPPLRQVIAQVRYPTILSLSSGGTLLGGFQEAIRSAYPFLQPLQQVSIALPGGQPLSPSGISQNAWQFADPDRRWSITLAPDALTLETERYSSFDDLSTQMALALQALLEYVRPGYRTRLGLRYVNEISAPGTEGASWSPLLNEHWRAIMDAGIVDGPVAHWIQNLRLPLEDGVFNIGAAFIPDGRPRVIIDLDCFDESQAELGTEEVMSRLNHWHGLIHSMFRWSISDETLAGLEVT